MIFQTIFLCQEDWIDQGVPGNRWTWCPRRGRQTRLQPWSWISSRARHRWVEHRAKNVGQGYGGADGAVALTVYTMRVRGIGAHMADSGPGPRMPFPLFSVRACVKSSDFGGERASILQTRICAVRLEVPALPPETCRTRKTLVWMKNQHDMKINIRWMEKHCKIARWTNCIGNDNSIS